MDKKFVCTLDQRRFKTKRALDQHRMMSHPGSGVAMVKNRASGSSQRRLPSQAGPQNVVAQPQRVRGMAGVDSATMSGLDRLSHVEDVSTLGSGASVFQLTVTPSSFKRLSKAAAVFQKIVYEKLIFRVEPQMSSTTSGGYVAGFVNDPDDRVTTLDQLTSVNNSVTTKWWQGCSVNAMVPRRNYFTSQGLELREFSPGSFHVMVDGQATQKGSLTVFCEWQVKMSGAILESPPFKPVLLQYDVYVRNGHQGLWADTGQAGDKRFSSLAQSIFGSVQKNGAIYMLPYPVGLVKPNDNIFALHHFVYVQDADSVFLAVNSPSDYYSAAYTVDNLVLTKGTAVERRVVSSVQGEARGPSSRVSDVTTNGPLESEEVSGLLRVLLRTFAMSSGESARSRPRPRARSASTERSSSMEFLP